MGQKVHPLGFRLGGIQKHRSQWFSKPTEYPKLLLEDYVVRKTLVERFWKAGIVGIHIERKVDQITVDIRVARPDAVVGRDPQNFEKLRQELEKQLKNHQATNMFMISKISKAQSNGSLDEWNGQIGISLSKVSTPHVEAAFLAELLAEQLEKRIPFRRAVRQVLKRAKQARVKGIKIQVSGRLNGAEIARSEWVREGRVPLQTLRAHIDYSLKTAQTIYGVLGIKIWLFKGEVLSNLQKSA